MREAAMMIARLIEDDIYAARFRLLPRGHELARLAHAVCDAAATV